jgi:hypothetical protein
MRSIPGLEPGPTRVGAGEGGDLPQDMASVLAVLRDVLVVILSTAMFEAASRLLPGEPAAEGPEAA